MSLYTINLVAEICVSADSKEQAIEIAKNSISESGVVLAPELVIKNAYPPGWGEALPFGGNGFTRCSDFEDASELQP